MLTKPSPAYSLFTSTRLESQTAKAPNSSASGEASFSFLRSGCRDRCGKQGPQEVCNSDRPLGSPLPKDGTRVMRVREGCMPLNCCAPTFCPDAICSRSAAAGLPTDRVDRKEPLHSPRFNHYPAACKCTASPATSETCCATPWSQSGPSSQSAAVLE